MSDNKPRIYTAGAMDWVGDGDSYWRESVAVETETAEFLHPDETYFDHGGDFVTGAVAEDMALINRCDGVVALFSESPQIGTVTEVVHAAATGTPVLALFDGDLFGRASDPDDSATPAFNAGEKASYRGEASDHWFLVNYLTGDDARGRAGPADWELPGLGPPVVERTRHCRPA